ncbi:cullin-1-like [Ochlerotatus camptorhynchus]|uniref:cullin-1-like n=1 Tax=Ochlerotatus camptorhynchus TaxID=644619 RepID=UPI0031D5D989
MSCPATRQKIKIDEVWADLEAGIQQIFRRDQNIRSGRYMELYTHVYNCSVKVQRSASDWQLGQTLFSRSDSTKLADESQHSGRELYYYLTRFLEGYLEDLHSHGSDLMDDEMLLFYTKQWEDFKFSSKVLNGLCSYLNRHWQKRECEERRTNVHEIYQLALFTWRENLLKNLSKQMSTGLLKLFDRERSGETINTRLVTETISSYVELSSNLDQSEPLFDGPNLSTYIECFQDAFLEHTEEFYTAESAEFLKNYSVSDYLKYVEVRLKEEEKRAVVLLHNSTREKLMTVCERVLIKKYLSRIYGEFKNLLDLEKIPDLIRLYQLMVRLKVDRVLTELGKHLEVYIHKQGLNAMLKAGDPALTDPMLYVQTILTVYRRYSTLIHAAFNSDNIFIAAMNTAFGKFVNRNAIIDASKSFCKSSENLARYCDMLLRKSSKHLEEQDFDDSLNEAITVFKFLEDKDAFEKFYSKLLSKRLCLQLSTSDDAEALMISKLKETCGFEYARKLHRMLQDMEISKGLNAKYQQMSNNCCSSCSDIDFNILVLSDGTWPLSPSFTLTLPFSVEQAVESFQKFYARRFSGRKLIWLYSMSRGEVVTNCFLQRYTLQVSTLQIAVLMQFNEHPSCTIQQLVEHVNVKLDYLIQVIQILLKVKLLTSSDEGDLKQESSVQLNTAFGSKKLRININHPLKAEVKVEQESSNRSIENDRKFMIQAAIVRIMKTRRSLLHSQLVGEVLNQLATRFIPKVQIVRKCIDALVDKEYIERRAGEKDVYDYLA